MAKAKLSIDWLSGCSGCEVGIVDLHDKLLAVLEAVDLVRCPILMDTKEYVKADVGMVTGSVGTEHDLKAAKKMRESCGAIIAFGTCPVYGGPQGAGHAHSNDQLLGRAFVDNPVTNTTEVPDDVPKLLAEGNLPLDSVIDVDLYMPGCPPHAAYIFEGLTSLLGQREPKFGRHSVCFNCDRKMVKTDVSTVKRMYEADPDRETCFLSQGVLCFGSVTLDRCMGPCPQFGVPCFSCGGPRESIILEPQKDVRGEVGERMSHLTKIPKEEIMGEIEAQAKTHFAYAASSPAFREKPTFLLKKWLGGDQTE